MAEESVGKVVHYFVKAGVAGLKLTGTLHAGDTVRFKGHTTDFTQIVESMQVENKAVEVAGPGDEAGIKVKDRVREHDQVLVVTE